MYIGYNIKKVNEVMEGIADAYWQSTKKIEEMYLTWFQPSLRQHWVGPDEVDFEKKFVERLNELLANTETLARNTISTIHTLANAWIDFQDSNVIGDGGTTGQGASLKSQLLTPVMANRQQISFTPVEFSGSENLGLSEAGSAAQLALQLNAFVTNTKSAVQQLFDAVDSNAAFFGEQSGKIRTYISKVGEVLGIVATSVKDFDEAMAKLTGTAYSTSDSSVSTEFDGAGSELDNGLEGLGTSRWTA